MTNSCDLMRNPNRQILATAMGLSILVGCGVEPRQSANDVNRAHSRPDEPAPTQIIRIDLPDDDGERFRETELWYDVDTQLANLQAWKERWRADIHSVKMVGGCECHVTLYRIRATRAAIDDFPSYEYRTTTDEIASSD